MCKIKITLNNLTTPTGTTLDRSIGQYRKIGDSTWTSFPINLNNLGVIETPDINFIGDYELRVNVTNNLNDTSEWSEIVTFQISANCVGSGNDIDPIPSGCYDWTLYKWVTPNNFNSLTVEYKDCDGVSKTLYVTASGNEGSKSFCASEILSYNINTTGLQLSQYMIDFKADFKGSDGYLKKGVSCSSSSSSSSGESILDYQMTNSTSIAPCGTYNPTNFPIAIKNNDSLKLNSIVLNTNETPFVGDGSWYYSSDYYGFRINQNGVIIEVKNCRPEM